MQSKYFTIEVKPTIPAKAAGLHAAFADGDVLFDWFEFNIPNSGGRLIGAHVEIRPKGDGDSTPNKFPLELLFARINVNHPDKASGMNLISTLGPVNTAPATFGGGISNTVNKFLGQVPIVAGDFADSIDPIAVASTSDTNGIVLQQHPDFNREWYKVNNSPPPFGYEKFFIGGLAGGAFNFVSETLINAGDLNGPTMTVTGTGAGLHIAPGDTVAACDATATTAEIAMGVVESLSATSIVLTEAFTTGDVANNDIVYNTKPIRIVLTFER